MTRRKIKLLDSDDLRNQLDSYYQAASQETCARFGRDLVEHLIELTGFKVGQEPDVEAGWAVSQACLAGQVRMHDVRQAGFKIHALAKQAENPIEQVLLRVVGHAVATAHMKEHAMVASGSWLGGETKQTMIEPSFCHSFFVFLGASISPNYILFCKESYITDAIRRC